jgi:hypothetical protein
MSRREEHAGRQGSHNHLSGERRNGRGESRHRARLLWSSTAELRHRLLWADFIVCVGLATTPA